MSSFRAASGLSVVWSTGRGPAECVLNRARVAAVVATVVRTKYRRDISLVVVSSWLPFFFRSRLFILFWRATQDPKIRRCLPARILKCGFADFPIPPKLGSPAPADIKSATANRQFGTSIHNLNSDYRY